MDNCKISSPFSQGSAPVPGKESAGGTFNHHTTPALNKPRDGGANLPTQFFSPMSGTPVPVTSPMSGSMGPIKKQ